ncbi:cupin domain-containing protein [Agromyces protaetiae]|uniref:Cupin domain-containing protein n=1 Tax=Agromyces protaetiae TaxID=2509455 RepID=A0A4P6FAQ1_9MICO|nr:cupin domain-containing protein [Agromyces protaetiae]QAY72755.1 cupin domain-containing protein [Agromyces protaetiae]
MTNQDDVRSIRAALDSFEEHWSPRRLVSVNDYDVKVAKVQGEFTWHSHPDTDELFLVVSGSLVIQLRDGGGGGPVREVTLRPGEVFVVPRGVQHCPRADAETEIVLFEPRGTVNTGDTPSERTAQLRELD